MTHVNYRSVMTSFLVLLIALALVTPFSTVLAASIPSGAGQPNQSCQAVTASPGMAASAPGSAFNPSGTAGTVYAAQQPQNSQNPLAVSQYDVACYQVSQH